MAATCFGFTAIIRELIVELCICWYCCDLYIVDSARNERYDISKSVLHTWFEQFSIGDSIIRTDIWYSNAEWPVMCTAVCVSQSYFSWCRMNLVCTHTILHTNLLHNVSTYAANWIDRMCRKISWHKLHTSTNQQTHWRWPITKGETWRSNN
jgi:hypothetical protein